MPLVFKECAAGGGGWFLTRVWGQRSRGPPEARASGETVRLPRPHGPRGLQP